MTQKIDRVRADAPAESGHSAAEADRSDGVTVPTTQTRGPGPRVRMVCRHCRSTNVKADAYAEWNEDSQQWEVSATFDKGGYCDDCDGETRIVEEPLPCKP